MDNLILEVKTVQSSAFRVLIEALKEILTDANFEFDSTGIKVMAMDSSHTVLVHLKRLVGIRYQIIYAHQSLILFLIGISNSLFHFLYLAEQI